jgi:predicted PurR-regulated permease PerM
MVVFILSFIAGLGVYIGISLVQQLKAINKSLTEIVFQEGELIKLTTKKPSEVNDQITDAVTQAKPKTKK